MENVVEIAERNSPLLLSLSSDLESLYFRKRQEGMTQNPILSMDYGQRKAANESGFEYSFQVEQPIYFPGRKELKQLLVDNDSKIKEIQVIEATNSVRLNAVKFAYRYLMADINRGHVKERLRRLAIIENYIRSRPFITPQAKTDLFILERRILTLKKHFNDLELLSSKNYESMNLYLRFDSVPLLSLPFFKDGIRFDQSDLEKKAIDNNPMLLTARGEVEKARTEYRLASLEKYPDYAVIGQVGEDKSGVANRYFDVGLKFRVPVWDQYQNKVASAAKNLDAKSNNVLQQENLIRMNLRQTILEYEKSKVNIKLFDLSKLEEIENDLTFADTEFSRSRIQILSYLELENQLHETYHAILDAQQTHIEAFLNLLYITNEKDIIGVLKNAEQTFKYGSK
ncbi:TolC family protein [Leptospira venezuelensis]|uniref:Outer membrane efflux protein n=2 Tax=Leptospiraceae TaxID=170 RepID=A0ABP2RI09_9LEPT|nr:MULTISPECIES: TolC family protein [Leptospira]EIE01320.1 outer membrane efflux protein [Leptospira licerasiae serovar Varillal str. VAR 010]EJZ43131.1 outer membrane efflux protein [Leptospira licerasiae str. MMD4847]EMK01209.1 outer membrane efflux protein [Leptospira sp. B5-022]MCR1795819.1 TolC family protein [Leptospira sp. id769339]